MFIIINIISVMVNNRKHYSIIFDKAGDKIPVKNIKIRDL